MKKRKWTAALLTLALLASLLPTGAFAAETPQVAAETAVTEPAGSDTAGAATAEETTTQSGEAAENPLMVPEEGLVIKNGTFYGISYEWFKGVNPEQQELYLSITLPDTVTVVYDDAFRDSWSNAKEDNGVATYYNGTRDTDWAPYEVAAIDFSQATALTTINNQAAMGAPLSGVLDLSQTKVETIGKSAFSGCTGLTGVILPDSLKVLGTSDGKTGSVFFGCSGLRFVTTTERYAENRDHPDFVDFSLPDGLTVIGKHTFANAFADVALNLVIPESVSIVGSEAFYPRSGSVGTLSYQPIRTIVVQTTDISGYDGRAFKFYDSGAPDSYGARVVVMPNKETYEAFMEKAEGNIQDEEANTYPLTVAFYNGETASGTPYLTQEKLYNQSFRYEKSGEAWFYNESYQLPETPDGTPAPGYEGSVWMMNGKALTADTVVTSDTVTLKAGGGLVAPEVKFKVTYLPHSGANRTEIVENGATVILNKTQDIRVDIVPVITHPLAGEETGDTFFWYKWNDSMDVRDDEGEDFAFGETINTLRVGDLEDARTGSAYYQLDIEGKTVSSNWGPDYDWDGSPVYKTDENQKQFYLYVDVVEPAENLAYVSASDYGYFIEEQPEKYGLQNIYSTADELIQNYLLKVFGDTTYIESDSYEGAELSISWQLKQGTTYSSEAGAENTFIWTASEEEFNALGWTNTNNIPLTGELTVKNPEPITITPADITVYSGGQGYTGIVDDAGNETAPSSGFPEPGFYITLPDALNDLLGGDGVADDLTDNHFTLNYAGDADTASRSWSLELYGTEGHSTTVDDVTRMRYIYRILPGKTADGEEYPVHMEVVDESGQVIESDEFEPSADVQHQDYTMRFCTEGLDKTKLSVSLVIDDKTYTCPVELADGNLTVRGLTDEKATTPVKKSETEVSGSQIAAVAPEGVTYYINGSNVEAVSDDVRLLNDVLINDDEATQAMFDYIKSDSNDLNIPLTDNTKIQAKYLDLVDAENGHAYLTLGEGQEMQIYWPVPSDFDTATTAHMVHFEGLDRDYDNAEDELKKHPPEQIVLDEIVTLNGQAYFTFQTDSFSPFVLVYDAKNGGGGTTTYTIDASAGAGGTISPSGAVRVVRGADKMFTITADEGYAVNDVKVDGESVGAVESYTFENVRQSHTISATFKKELADPDDTGVSDWLDTENHGAYLGGYPDGTFAPGKNMTRAEVAQMFYNLLLDKNVDVTETFADVPQDAWYADEVNALASLGILRGVGDNQFAPERPITRAEFTVIAMRFAKLPSDGENIFSDVHEGDWFYKEVVGSIQYGWIAGYEDGTFRPNATITRAEVTAIANRMLGREADEAFIDAHAGALKTFGDLPQSYWAYATIMEATNAHDYDKTADGEHWTGLK